MLLLFLVTLVTSILDFVITNIAVIRISDALQLYLYQFVILSIADSLYAPFFLICLFFIILSRSFSSGDICTWTFEDSISCYNASFATWLDSNNLAVVRDIFLMSFSHFWFKCTTIPSNCVTLLVETRILLSFTRTKRVSGVYWFFLYWLDGIASVLYLSFLFPYSLWLCSASGIPC